MSTTVLGALLALAAAVALNGSYLIQHAGSRGAAIDARRPLATLGALLRSPLWSLGALVGIAGWALHVSAMREAPLSLVQAFVAGGLALAVPIAAFGARQRLAPAELRAIAVMVLALALLSLGMRGEHGGHTDQAALAAWVAVLAAGAAITAARGWLGVAGGLLYGAADLALKAVVGGHPAWIAAAAATTVGAFFAFQRGLQSERPLAVIALMTAATNVSSIAGALVVYAEPLGRTPQVAAAHALAFVLVVAASWRLAPAAHPAASS